MAIRVVIHTERFVNDEELGQYGRHLVRCGVSTDKVVEFLREGKMSWESQDPGGPVTSTYTWTRES